MFFFELPDDFTFPGFGVRCQECGEKIPAEDKRGTGYCADCEFTKLTPPAWLELFMVCMELWVEGRY